MFFLITSEKAHQCLAALSLGIHHGLWPWLHGYGRGHGLHAWAIAIVVCGDVYHRERVSHSAARTGRVT